MNPFRQLLVVMVLAFPGLAPFSAGCATAASFSLDTNVLQARLERLYYHELQVVLGMAEEKSNAITDKWKEDGAFTLMAAFLRGNPKAMKIFKEQLKAGKSPKQALKKAVEKEGNGTPFAAINHARKYIGPEVQAIYGDLEKVAARAKSRLDALTKAADRFETIKSETEFTDLMREYGLGGSGIDSFQALEKRLQKIRSVLESPVGTYWGMYDTIYKGVEGKAPGARAEALFSLIDQTAGNLPILGEFVSLYMSTAKEMLAATLRLKKIIARWDMGCVGTGTHGVTLAQNERGVKFKYPGTACPEGDIKDLYVDFENPGLLYFWTGKKWLKAPAGVGGATAIRKIIQMLKTVAKASPGVKTDVPAAFAIYGIPGGFTANYGDAETLRTEIQDRWIRLKHILASENVTKARAVEILETRSGVGAGFDSYLDKHFSLNRNRVLFDYRYILSRLGDGRMIEKNREILKQLNGFHPRIIVGTLDLPDGLDLAGTRAEIRLAVQQDVLVERQQISLPQRSFRMLVFGGTDARLEYLIMLGDMESNRLVIDSWQQTISRHRAKFDVGLNIAVKTPDRVEVGQAFTLRGHIDPDSSPPFDLSWQINGKAAGHATTSTGNFTIPLTFAKPGQQDVELTVTDARGAQGDTRLTIPVAFRLEVETESVADNGGELVVFARVIGGSGDYALRWARNGGQTFHKDSARNRFFQRFSDPGQASIKWVDLAVFDRQTRIEVPLRIYIEGAAALSVSLVANPSTLLPGANTSITATATGGEAGFLFSLFADGFEIDHQATDGRKAQFTASFSKTGSHRLRVVLTDKAGATAEKTMVVTVNRPVQAAKPAKAAVRKTPKAATGSCANARPGGRLAAECMGASELSSQ